jgi:CRP-like cAMP-binding protein
VTRRGGAPGDPAEDFYVIEWDRFDVFRTDADGTHRVRALAQGDWFGEVGLIHNAPRNATVRARWPSTVWRIDGAQLLAAVNGAPAMSARLREAARHPGEQLTRCGAAVDRAGYFVSTTGALVAPT